SGAPARLARFALPRQRTAVPPAPALLRRAPPRRPADRAAEPPAPAGRSLRSAAPLRNPRRSTALAPARQPLGDACAIGKSPRPRAVVRRRRPTRRPPTEG